VLEVGLGIAGQHVTLVGELNLPSVDDFDRQDLVRTPSRRIEASSPLQIRSSL
jgi:hypothetical protein